MREQQTNAGGQNYISHDNDGDDMAQQYESVFTDMSYQAFNSRFPEMAPNVTTFQVIVSDIEDGSAVGAFLLDMAGDIYHVPVVLMDNKIKPMDMVYSKNMDKFFPFTPEWLSVIEGSSHQEEGHAINKKDLGLQAPQDLTQTLQPPTAAYRGGLGLSPTGMSQMPGMNTIASKDDYKDVPNFTELLKVASNDTKKNFLKLLKDNQGVFKFAAEKFDMGLLKEAMQEVNEVADAVETDELRILDIDSPVEKIKETFEGSAVKAMEDIAKRGFTAKDSRKNLNEVYDIEGRKVYEEATVSGYYKLCKRDGTMPVALVLFDLVDKRGPYTNHYHEPMGVQPDSSHSTNHTNKNHGTKLVIFEDGTNFSTHQVICGEPCVPTGDSGTKFSKLLTASSPKKKDAITFVKKCKDTFKAVEPFYVDQVVMEPSGTICYKELDPYFNENSNYDKGLHSSDIGKKDKNGRTQVAILPSLPTAAKPFYSDDKNTLYVDKGYVPYVLGEAVDSKDYMLDLGSIVHFLKHKAHLMGSKDVKLSNRGGNDYSVNGKPSGNMKKTAEYVANEYHAPFEPIYEKLASLRFLGDKANLLVVPFEKAASIFIGTPGTQVTPEMVQEQFLEQQQQQMPQQQQQMPQQQMPQQQMQQQPQAMQPNYEMPQQPQSYMDPTMMQAGAGMQNEEMYNLGAIQSIVEDPKVMEMMQEYTPALEKAMDNSARLLLTLWTEGGEHKENLGALKFKELEGSARNAFKELGKLLLLVTKQPGEIA